VNIMKVIIPKSKKDVEHVLKDPLFKNSYFLMLSTITSSFLGFIFWMLIAQFYSTEDVGLATALISAMGLLTSLSMVGFNIGIIRFLPNSEDKHGMINSCLTMVALVSIMLTMIFIVGLNVWSPALIIIQKNWSFSLLFIVFTLIYALLRMLYNTFIAMRSAKFTFIQNTIWSTLKIPFSLLLVPLGAFWIFFSWGIAMCIALIFSIFLFIPIILPMYHYRFTIKKRIVNDMFRFSFGNYVAGFFSSIPPIILPLLIINILGSEATAYFYIAWTITAGLLMISESVNKSLFAEGSFEVERLQINVVKAIKFLFFLIIPIIVGIFLFGNYLLLLFGEAYSVNALMLLKILALSVIPATFNEVFVTIKRIKNEVKPIIYIYMFIGIFTIGLSYMLMTKIGLMGVGIGWILSNVVVMMTIIVHTSLKRIMYGGARK